MIFISGEKEILRFIQFNSPHSLSFRLYYLGIWCDWATSQDPRTNPPFKANQMIEMPGTLPSVYVLFKHCFIRFFVFVF